MPSKLKQSKKTFKAKPHFSVYLTNVEMELVRRAAKKQKRKVANYIAAIIVPQASRDLEASK